MEEHRYRQDLLRAPQRIAAAAIQAGDRISCWHPVRVYDRTRSQWVPAPNEMWKRVWTAVAASNQRDHYHRWTTSVGLLVHTQHVRAIDEEDFRAAPDDAGTYEILLKEPSEETSL